jgi:hypothetical protein
MQILRHSKVAITMEIHTEVVSSTTALAKANERLGPRDDSCTLRFLRFALLDPTPGC